MTTLVIISLGALGGAVLEAAARRSDFDDIVVASRDLRKAEAKVNNARIGAALEGRYPRIHAQHFDMHAPDAASRLRDIGGDVLFTAPSMLPWWQLDALSGARRALVSKAPFGVFTACHLAPMLAFRDAYAASGSSAHWVGASSPDVVNAILARTGIAPVCGTGNVAEVIPKLRLVLNRELDCAPDAFDIRLVAQHAFEYYCYSDTPAQHRPPYLLYARHDERDCTAMARAALFEPCPIPYAMDFNRVTASASISVLDALTASRPVAAHVPAPNGLVGGYPVRVSRLGVELDLAPGWSAAQARQVNHESLPFDGIASIDDDGTLHFSGASIQALREITGDRWETMRPADAPALAARLAQRLG